LSLITELKARQRNERCVVITAYGSTANAVEALKAGAFDYLTKPVDLKQFRSVIAAALRSPPVQPAMQALQPGQLQPESNAEPERSGAQALARLVGQSTAIRQIKERILKVAPSMAPVMVTGESGTGKELVALAIHSNSHRAQGAWIAVNCSAIPENLLEAEFFGAKKGAYTGATQDRHGFFQAAQGGTLFLDEIGDLPLAMQAKLLRAIQERRVRPLGSTQEDLVDVRIISATHKDLASEVQQGNFRQDLYYRLNVIELVITPLRERQEDLPELCDALLSRIAQEAGLPKPNLGADLLAQLAQLPMPGNVRELENLLHRSIALGDLDQFQGKPVTIQTVAASAPSETQIPSDLQAYLDTQERAILIRTLQETNFNRTAAASRLGLSLRQIRYRIARLGIATATSDENADDDAFDASH
ncbi:MAG: sigma-54 dependent transcriptional regulator, partial [Rhodoferax sp.]|nr:sigma-54 dependent transcriptional regulator [Rhodoferax sp.]